jgi:hypothetical protein
MSESYLETSANGRKEVITIWDDLHFVWVDAIENRQVNRAYWTSWALTIVEKQMGCDGIMGEGVKEDVI